MLAIILERLHSLNPDILDSPVFIMPIFLIIFLVTNSLFVLLFSTCLKYKQGYFSITCHAKALNLKVIFLWRKAHRADYATIALALYIAISS